MGDFPRQSTSLLISGTFWTWIGKDRDNITANVKKNISKLINQSQDAEEDENDSDDDNLNPEEYSVQNDGWHIVEKLKMETVQNYIISFSP